MNIEKKKVAKNKPLPSAAKNAIVGLLGMTAAISLGACENGSSADSDDEPLDGDVFIPPNNQKNPQSSSETATQTSSSSQIVDIPLSHEPLSSSAIEALSSVAQTTSSSTIKTTSSSAEKTSPKYSSSYVSSGVSSAMQPTPKSSSAADTSSSVTTQQSSSSQTESAATSSSDAQTISSSEAPISSSQASSNPIETNSSSSITPQPTSASFPYRPSVDCLMDSTGLKVIMCQDEHGGMMGSMVSTYDMTETI